MTTTHTYKVRASSGLILADAIAYLLTNHPAEQPDIMNSMSIHYVHPQKNETEFTFQSKRTAEQVAEIMAQSNDPRIIHTFQPHQIVTYKAKKRTADDMEADQDVVDEALGATEQPMYATEPGMPNKKETMEYAFLVRCQLVTSKNKTDTYYALDQNNQVVFVKGPYVDDRPIQTYIHIQQMKKDHNIPYLQDLECVYMCPDRWPEGTAIGVRNKLKHRTTTAYPFLVSPSIISVDILKTKIKSSKTWPPTEVVDSDSGQHVNPVHRPMSDQEWMDYLHAIAFRVKYQMGDLADRNFIMVDGRVMSVDESYILTPVNLSAVLQKAKYEIVIEKSKRFRDQLMEWAHPIFDREYETHGITIDAPVPVPSPGLVPGPPPASKKHTPTHPEKESRTLEKCPRHTDRKPPMTDII